MFVLVMIGLRAYLQCFHIVLINAKTNTDAITNEIPVNSQTDILLVLLLESILTIQIHFDMSTQFIHKPVGLK